MKDFIVAGIGILSVVAVLMFSWYTHSLYLDNERRKADSAVVAKMELMCLLINQTDIQIKTIQKNLTEAEADEKALASEISRYRVWLSFYIPKYDRMKKFYIEQLFVIGSEKVRKLKISCNRT